MLAPIVLFVYNRPKHTLQTLEALSKNTLADQSSLFIFSDGYKEGASSKDIKNIDEVRKIIASQKWCKTVEIIEADKNKGLKNAIIDGVTSIVNQYGSVIVLEDDIVTSPGFLKFMNDALKLYADEEKVMHISAYSPPTKEKLPELFFYEVMHCWGWGTWKRAWDKLNKSDQYILNRIQMQNKEKHFDLDNSDFFLPQLQSSIKGLGNTWCILWYGSIYIHGGYCLNPGVSLIQNIGLDGSGVHCYKTEDANWSKIDFLEVSKIDIKALPEVRKIISRYYKYAGKSMLGHYYATLKGKMYRCYTTVTKKSR